MALHIQGTYIMNLYPYYVILYNAQSQLSLCWKQTKWIQRNK